MYEKEKNKLPDFSTMTLEQEAEWFDTHAMGDYWDELEDVQVVVDLDQPKTETLILRLQKNLKKKLERIAKSKGLNVSTLARMWLIERLNKA